ncbi:MAG: type III pantothenate kinase [Acholeplasmataceae bacterium]|jgi:type III pantothenate kinase|nr:type III pantothenate kinase [Acholeplasmataceae bacterium]
MLLFDVGNTEVKMGIYREGKIIEKYRFMTNPNISEDEFYLMIYPLIDKYIFKKIAISSVVPNITRMLRMLSLKRFYFEPIVVEPGVKTGLKILTDNPQEVGADIICASVRASSYDKNTLVIDLGTAIKYIYVSNKALKGVIIAPGVEVSMMALTENTALLPKFEIKVPKKVLGTNTVECMQSGVTYGIASQIDGLINFIKKEIKEDFKVVFTGGLAPLIMPLIKHDALYDENLVLEGLIEIVSKN